MKKHSIEALQTRLNEKLPNGAVMLQEPMAAHTTFKIGGPADIFVEPTTLEELQYTLRSVAESELPLTIFGSGSNVLVRDGGIRGVVLSLCKLLQTKRCEGTRLVMGAGFMLKEVSEYALANELTGLEFAVGIPGTLGGAVFMNAGAYGGEMCQVIRTVRTVDLNGDVHTYSGEELKFGYRHSVFQENHEIIAEVEMELQKGDKYTIEGLMLELTAKREAKQPLEYPSAGSTFKRPPGLFAGTLIDQTGLKGLQVGGAQVSEKHAGFVINKNQATAADVLDLITAVQVRVHEAHGVMLETEVRIVGEQ